MATIYSPPFDSIVFVDTPALLKELDGVLFPPSVVISSASSSKKSISHALKSVRQLLTSATATGNPDASLVNDIRAIVAIDTEGHVPMCDQSPFWRQARGRLDEVHAMALSELHNCDVDLDTKSKHPERRFDLVSSAMEIALPEQTQSTLILQICVDERAWILDLPELGIFANGFLNRMFSDATILKVGVSLKGDFDGLRATYPAFPCYSVFPSPSLDLQRLFAVCYPMHPNTISLVDLCQQFLKQTMRKSKQTQLSDWAQRPLSQMQSEYAAADVLVLPGILHRLVRDSKIQPDKFMLALHIGPSSTSALSNSASSSDSKHDCAVVSGLSYDFDCIACEDD